MVIELELAAIIVLLGIAHRYALKGFFVLPPAPAPEPIAAPMGLTGNFKPSDHYQELADIANLYRESDAEISNRYADAVKDFKPKTERIGNTTYRVGSPDHERAKCQQR